MLEIQPELHLVPDDSNHHPRPRPLLALSLGRQAVGLGRSVASLALISGKFLADGALAAPDSLSDLSLGFSRLPHVGDHVTFFRAEAVVFVVHSQFVVKPD